MLFCVVLSVACAVVFSLDAFFKLLTVLFSPVVEFHPSVSLVEFSSVVVPLFVLVSLVFFV